MSSSQIPKDIFKFLPIQLWVCIFSFLRPTDKNGRKLHHSLSLCCKSGRNVSNHELIWQVRLCLAAVHFGYCFITNSPANNNKNQINSNLSHERDLMSCEGFAGYLKRKEKERTDAQFKSKFPVVGRQSIEGSESSALSVFRNLKLRCSGGGVMPGRAANTIMSVNDDGDENISPTPQISFSVDDAPICFSLFALSEKLSCFKKRFLYLYLLATLKCCVCAKTVVARLTEEDLKKGMEFTFPHSVAKYLVENFVDFSRDEPNNNNSVLDRLIKENRVVSWTGLRICIDCIAALHLGFQEISDVKESSGMRRERNNNNQREEKEICCSLGPVNLLPKDFEGVGNSIKNTNKNSSVSILGNLIYSLKNNVNFDELGLSDPLGLVDFIKSQI